MLYIYIHVFCLQLRKKRLERLSGLSPSQSPQSSQLTTPTTESKPDPEKSDGRDVNQEWVSQSQLISSQTEDLLRVEHDGILDSLEDKTSKVRTGDSQSMDTCSASQELVTVEQVQENSLSPFPSLQSGPGSLNRQQIHQPLKVTTTPLMGPAIPSPIILVEKVLRVKLLVSSHTCVIAGYTYVPFVHNFLLHFEILQMVAEDNDIIFIFHVYLSTLPLIVCTYVRIHAWYVQCEQQLLH